MEVKTFKKGTVIARQGDFELFMYVINYGKVGVYLEYGTPQQHLIEIDEGQHAIFGENGMFLSEPRYATFVALEDTEAYVVTLEMITEYFAGKPAKVVEMMQTMCEKNKHLATVFGDACHAMADYIKDEKASKERPGLLGSINRFFSLNRQYNKK